MHLRERGRGLKGFGGSVALCGAVLTVLGAVLLGVALSPGVHPPQPALTAPSPLPTLANPPVASAAGGEPTTALPMLAASVPVAIEIPAIKVRSAVQRLGQTPSGAVAVPAPGPHYDQVGWYQFSPTPGSTGPAVMVGHVDSAEHGPSVFWRLGSMQPGQEIDVRRSDGTVAVFSVMRVVRYAKTRFPTELVYGNTRDAELRLLTCGGPIVGGHYRDNVIVFARMIRTRSRS